METEGSSPYTQEPATCPYPEPDQSIYQSTCFNKSEDLSLYCKTFLSLEDQTSRRQSVTRWVELRQVQDGSQAGSNNAVVLCSEIILISLGDQQGHSALGITFLYILYFRTRIWTAKKYK
jgi:hypothetical protein